MWIDKGIVKNCTSSLVVFWEWQMRSRGAWGTGRNSNRRHMAMRATRQAAVKALA